MLINHTDLQNDGWIVVTARSLAAAGSFCSNESSRPILQGVLVESTNDGTFLTATDSYKMARIRTSNLVGTNPEGVKVLVNFSELKKAKLISARPNQKLAVAVKQDGNNVKVKMLEKQYVGYEERGEATLRVIEGNFPDWKQIDKHEKMKTAKKQSNIGPGLNTSYLINIFKAIELAVSETGATVTQFVHGGVLEPIYFHAQNTEGEDIWTIQMPVRL